MKKILTILVAVLSVCGLSFAVYAQMSGRLVAHYTFEEGAGNIVTNTEGGYGGTIHGPSWGIGKEGGGLAFDGTNDYIELNNISISGKKLTLSAFVLFDGDITNNPRIISKAKYLDKQNWSLAFHTESNTTGGFEFNLNTDETNYTTITQPTFTPELNKWYHVAGTYDGSNMKLYVDGQLIKTTPKLGYTISDDNKAWIGGNPSAATDSPWKGAIDEVRVYSKVLSQTEIQDLFNDSNGGGNSTPPTKDEITFVVVNPDNYDNIFYIDSSYTGTSITSEGCIDLFGTRYLILKVK